MEIDPIGSEFVKGVYTSRDLRLSHPIFLKVFPELKTEFGLLTKMELHISCTYRSPRAQQDLYAIGRQKSPIGKGYIVTNCDGVKNLSNHNLWPSRALDCYITYAGKAVWDKDAFKPLGELAPKYGLVWGGSWERWKDLPHLELAGTESIS